MAKIKLQGNANGSGVFTLTSPNSNTDRTITLPDGTGTLAFTTGDDDKLPLAGGTMTGELTVSQSANSEAIDVATDGTTVNGLRVNASELTTGKAGYFYSNASGSQTRQLVRITNDHASATGTTGLYIDNDSTGLVADFHGAAGIRSANGIKFGTDTAAANALDDYEEGTWSPTITCETSGSYTLQGGADLAAYTKIGRVVTVQGGLSVNGESSPNGNLRITLPFTAFTGADDTDYCMGNLALGNHGSTLDVAGLNAFTYGGTYFFIWGVNPDGTTRYINNNDVDTNFQVYFNFSYIAA